MVKVAQVKMLKIAKIGTTEINNRQAKTVETAVFLIGTHIS